jgi:hypothetical protein
VLNNLYEAGEWPRDFTGVAIISSKEEKEEEARSYKMQ